MVSRGCARHVVILFVWLYLSQTLHLMVLILARQKESEPRRGCCYNQTGPFTEMSATSKTSESINDVLSCFYEWYDEALSDEL